MNTETYRFRIGSFESMAVSDGTMTYAPPMFPPPASFLFVNSEEKSLFSALREHGIDPLRWNAWISPYTCLFIDTRKENLP